MSEAVQLIPGSFCWTELATTDASAAKRFYCELFGWEAVDQPAGAMGTYTMLRLRGKAAGALFEIGGPMAGMPPHWERVHSRFGVMFFAEPVAAFRNLHRATAPEGKLAFLCWQGLAENPWLAIPAAVARRHVELPTPDPLAPGPLAFADAERVGALLAGAGWRNIRMEGICEPLQVAGGMPLERAVELLLELGPAGAALRGADPALVERVRSDLHRALAPYETSEGLVLGSAAWLVTAAG